MEKASGCLVVLGTLILGFILLIILTPLSAMIGWVVGWILSWTVGNSVVGGINLLFGTTLSTNQLPIIFAALGAIGSMFKSSTTQQNKK